MKCPKCEFDNREGAKFCKKCGSKLELICPSCSSPLESDSLFCDECGTKLPGSKGPDLSPLDEKIDKIQRYLPAGLTEKILAQKDRIEGEKKNVTVLFCDLVGYTKMASNLGPEETYALMDQIMELLIHKVHDYGGTVNQLLGDGLYALFGAPIALEDGPQRAIRSAIDMHKEIKKFSEKISKEKNIPPLVLRIGINSGPVVVGTIGNTLRVEFTAVGDTVNLASRMETLADPGTTFVTEETFKLAEVFFRFEGMGERQVKGKEDPVKVFQVIAPSDRSTRFDVSAERGLTPLVGKERELEQLLDGFEMVKSGRGQAFSIVAEAGTGKSRLLYEFRKKITNEDVTILEGKCLSFGKNTAYLPILEVAKTLFAIEKEDEEDKIREKMQNELSQLQLDTAEILPFLLELFSFKKSGIDLSIKTPELVKERIIEFIIKLLLKSSEKQPVVLIIEDLHWIDRNSEDLLKEFLESISGSNVMVVNTYRPEYEESWSRKSYHNQINLNHLLKRESTFMICNVLNTDKIDAQLEDIVVEKTEGNPFYIEEFVKSLLDLNIIKKSNDSYFLDKDIDQIDLPATIQNIIMSRVDQLPEEAREILQMGSVIEREFSFELIKHLSDFSDTDLIAHLSIIKESELLFERGLIPNTVYIFKHALTRDVIYDSILSSQKKILHEKVANAVLELHKDQLESYYEILARHYKNGGIYHECAKYSKLAGHSARKKGSLFDALSFFKDVIISLEKLPLTNSSQYQIIDARTHYAYYCIALNHHSEAMDIVRPIVKTAEELDYKKASSIIQLVIGCYKMLVENDTPGGEKAIFTAIKEAEKIQDFPTIWQSYWFLAVGATFNSEFQKCATNALKCLEVASLANHRELTIWAKSFLSFPYGEIGEVEKGFRLNAEALEEIERGDIVDSRLKGSVYASYGMICLAKGMLSEAEKYLKRAADLCRKSGFFLQEVCVCMYIVLFYFTMERFSEAQTYLERFQSIEDNEVSFYNDNLNASSLLLDVLKKEADFDSREAIQLFEQLDFSMVRSGVASAITMIILNNPDIANCEAEFWIKKSFEIDTKADLKIRMAFTHWHYSKFFIQENNLPQAQEQMNKAIDTMKECGADGWVERYEKELAEL